MLRSTTARRARGLLVAGLAFALLSGGTGHAKPQETSSTRCETTVCATAGSQVEIVCSRPNPQTVECEGRVWVWGIGRPNTPAAGVPGVLEWYAEARCGGECASNQLGQGAAAWNGVTSWRGEITRFFRLPLVRKSQSARACIFYSVTARSVSTSRALHPLQLETAEANTFNYLEAKACNQM